MKDEIDITVALTCYNEEKYIVDTLENAISALCEVGCSYEVIVIDDASRDDSVQRIKKYIESHPDYPVTLKVNNKNRGLANNYIEGAFLGKGKYYRVCNGDDPEPKEVLVNIFKYIGKADIIIPWQDQKEVVGKSLFRKCLSRVFTRLVNLISGYNIKYYNGNAIHLRYNVMRWHPSSYGFGFQADITTRLLDEGASYIQIKSRSIDRKGSDSTALTVRNILSVIHTLWELTTRRVRKFLYGKNMAKPTELKP